MDLALQISQISVGEGGRYTARCGLGFVASLRITPKIKTWNWDSRPDSMVNIGELHIVIYQEKW